MLQDVINEFLDYCRLADFSPRSRQALTARLSELQAYLKTEKLESVHVSIEKSVPQFLTQDEYSRLLGYFGENARDLPGLRNLVMVILIGTLGLRTATLIAIDISDVDIGCGLIWVIEKGKRRRSMILPYVLCEVIQRYLDLLGHSPGPLFISNRFKRINQRTLQDVLQKGAKSVGIDKTIHPRLFRHTAATHLNRVSDIDITQHVLGHSRRANTFVYTHLNPDQFHAPLTAATGSVFETSPW